jgi:single-stranded DNA-binding protein
VQNTHKCDRVCVEGSLTLAKWTNADGEPRAGLAVSAWKVERLGNIGRDRAPDEGKPPPATLPIALPAIKRRKFGLFRKRKAIPQESENSAPVSSDNGRPFDDALPF